MLLWRSSHAYFDSTFPISGVTSIDVLTSSPQTKSLGLWSLVSLFDPVTPQPIGRPLDPVTPRQRRPGAQGSPGRSPRSYVPYSWVRG